MAISFDKTFDKVKECFQEESIKSVLEPKLEAVTIIRDVNGKIRLFLDLLEGEKTEEVDTDALDQLLSQKLGTYYGKDIWLPQGTKMVIKL